MAATHRIYWMVVSYSGNGIWYPASYAYRLFRTKSEAEKCRNNLLDRINIYEVGEYKVVEVSLPIMPDEESYND